MNDDIEFQFSVASQKGNVEEMNILLEAKANVNYRDSYLNTPLYTAAWFGRVEAVKLLIEAKANVNHDNPLYTATRKGNLDIMNLLIEAKADVNRAGNYNDDAGGTSDALMTAVSHNHVEIVRLLLESGASTSNLENAFNLHRLSYAGKCLARANSDIQSLLIESKAKFDYPFHSSDKCQWGCICICKDLSVI